jgi:predicted RNase H-like nuclease (RuvC/YqgF family)
MSELENPQTDPTNEDQTNELIEANIGGEKFKIDKKLFSAHNNTLKNFKQQNNKLNSVLSEKENQLLELQTKLEQYENSKLSETEQISRKYSKELEMVTSNYKKVEQEKTQLSNKLKNYHIDSQIRETLSSFDLYNQKQALTLFKSENNIEFENDSATVIINRDGIEMRVGIAEALKDFLSKEENQNLLKPSARSGAGTKPTNGQGSFTRMNYTRDNLKDSKIRAQYMTDLKNGLNPVIE